jgi:hypothetical protein
VLPGLQVRGDAPVMARSAILVREGEASTVSAPSS